MHENHVIMPEKKDKRPGCYACMNVALHDCGFTKDHCNGFALLLAAIGAILIIIQAVFTAVCTGPVIN